MVNVNTVSNEVKNLLGDREDSNNIEKINDISYLICSSLVEQGENIEGEFSVWHSGPMLESLAFGEENIQHGINQELKEKIHLTYNEIMKNSYSDAEFSLMTSLYDEAWNRAYAEKKAYIPWSYVK